MSPPHDNERRFVSRLEELVRNEDLGALAALRRGLGRRPGEAAEMYPYVVPYLPREERRQDAYFLVASLFALHQKSWPDDERSSEPRNLGASFARLTSIRDSGSLEKRFVALLNCDREDLPHHLRHAVSLLRSDDVPIDWAQLLGDVQNWNREGRWVQRSWARAFWGYRPTPEETSGEAVAAAAGDSIQD